MRAASGLLLSSPGAWPVFLQDLTYSDPPWHHRQSGGHWLLARVLGALLTHDI